MATAEVASASTDPRYAPYDPSLPQPWKGLVDGSTGSLYYWNPETNITQYERPASLPSGPAVPSTPTLAPIPGARTMQPNGFPSQPGQQVAPVSHQHPSQPAQAEQQQGPGQPAPQNTRPQVYPHQQMPSQGNQTLPQAHLYQGAQMGQPPGYQFAHQQMQNVAYNQNNHTQVQPQLGQAPQFGGSSINAHRPSGMDLGHQQRGPGFHTQQGSGFHFSANNGRPDIIPQQPKLAVIPMARNQQEMMSGGRNPAPGPTLNGIYSNPGGGGGPFPHTDTTRVPSVAMESANAINLSPTDVYCQKNEISVSGDNVPAPFISFQDTGFPPEILREIHSAGFSSPTPIQAQTWPIALQSKDIVAIAKTGSGKTLGYLIPAFMLLRRCRNNPQNGPTVVILAPTRELATQIQDEVIKFGRSSRVSCTCLYGGAPKGPQLKELERGAEIVVATPGRLNDILEMKKVDFGQVSLFVLDEADRMLDMGFEPQIRKIVNEIPPRRQTLMYTATWPKEVKKIASDLLVNPVQVNIGRVDELAANKSITQLVEIVPQNGKQRRLEEILRSQERGSKIIIFCSTKRLCDQLTRSIGRNFGAAAIHGDKSQGERDWVLSQFRTGKSPVLVATDVAARGLDVKDIRVVVNYDFPNGVEDYVHRIGRTGRAGATGLAYTFFSDQDWKNAAGLIKVLEGASQAVPKEVRDIALRGGPSFGSHRRGGGGGRGRWESGGRGGNRDQGFGGRDGMRDGNFGGRGGTMGGNLGSRGGGRGGGFGGPDRYGNAGRGRFDNRRDVGERSRGRSYSPSPDRVQSRGRSRSYSRSSSQSRSRSRSPKIFVRRRESKFDRREVPLLAESGSNPLPLVGPGTTGEVRNDGQL